MRRLVLTPSLVVDADAVSAHEAVEAIVAGGDGVVADLSAAREVLGMLGLSPLEVEDRITFGLTGRVLMSWPWTTKLPDHEMVLLAREVADTAEMCWAFDTWEPFDSLMADWEATTRAWANGARPVVVEEPRTVDAVRPTA